MTPSSPWEDAMAHTEQPRKLTGHSAALHLTGNDETPAFEAA